MCSAYYKMMITYETLKKLLNLKILNKISFTGPKCYRKLVGKPEAPY